MLSPGLLSLFCPKQHWNIYICCCVSSSVVSNSLWPHRLYSPLESSVHGILQARILERVTIPFSRGSSWPRDWTLFSCRFFTVWAAREAQNIHSVQFSSVAQSCPTLCDPMNHSTPGLPVHHQPPEFTQTHVPRVSDAIQPSHPLSSPSPPAPNPSQHQGLFQWVNSSHQEAKVLEFQLQHQSFQWTPGLISFRMDWLDLLAVRHYHV